MNKRVTLLALLSVFLVLIGAPLAHAQTPNPGHAAWKVGPGTNGTFAPGNFTFQNNLNVSGIIYTPQLCLNGDCQTSWPTGGGSGNVTAINGSFGFLAMFTNSSNINASSVVVNRTSAAVYVGIGTTTANEELQIGSTMAFHSGGYKLFTYNHDYDREGTTSDRRRVDGYAMAMGFQPSTGGIAFRTGSNGSAKSAFSWNTRLFINNSGSVGIGTTSPTQKLDVRGNINTTGIVYAPQICLNGSCQTDWPDPPADVCASYQYSTWDGSQFQCYNVTSNGATTLTIPRGSIAFQAASTTWTNMPSAVTEFTSPVRWSSSLAGWEEMRITGRVSTVGAANAVLYFQYNDSTEAGTWSSLATSNISVGSTGTKGGSWITIPDALKTDGGFIRLAGQLGDGALDPQFRGIYLELRRSAITIGGGNITGVGTNGTIPVFNTTGGLVNSSLSQTPTKVTVATGLDVGGTLNATTIIYSPQICLNGDCQTSWPAGGSGNVTSSNGSSGYVPRFTSSTNIATGSIYDNGTAVGVGTNSPQYPFQIVNQGTFSWDVNNVFNVQSNGITVALLDSYSDTGYASGILRMRKADGTADTPLTVANGEALGRISGVGYNGTDWEEAALLRMTAGTKSGTAIPGAFDFWTAPADGSGIQRRLTINQDGNVGIGTASPSQRLDIVGNATIAGNLRTTVPSTLFPKTTLINYSARTITTGGDFIYIGSNDGKFYVLDAAVPSAPRMVANVSLSSTQCRGISAQGQYVLLTCRAGSGLAYLFDVSQPAAPVLLGSDGGNANDVLLSGRYAYGAYDADFLQRWDTIGGTLTALPNLAVNATGGNFDVQRDLLVYGDYNKGITLLNISDPRNPIEIGKWPGAGTTVGLALRGAYIFTADDSQQVVHVIDITNASNPSYVVNVSLGAYPEQVIVSGDYAFATLPGANKVTVLDISDPRAPTNLGNLSVGETPMDLAVYDRYVYVASRAGNLTLFELPSVRTAAIQAGTARIGNLLVQDDLDVQGRAALSTSLTVGPGGIHTTGPLSANGNNNSIMGTLGINTTSTTQLLDVRGNANITGAIYTPQICLNGDCQTSWPAATGNITGTGTNGTIAMFNTSGGIVASGFRQNGSVVTLSKDLAIPGAGRIASTGDLRLPYDFSIYSGADTGGFINPSRVIERDGNQIHYYGSSSAGGGSPYTASHQFYSLTDSSRYIVISSSDISARGGVGSLGSATYLWNNLYINTIRQGSTPASTGSLRLSYSNTAIQARNNANSADILIAGVDTSNRVLLGGSAGILLSGVAETSASTTTRAGLRLPHGTAPSSPTNGDVWTTTSGMYAYINGGTVGPFGIGNVTESGGVANYVPRFTTSSDIVAGLIQDNGTKLAFGGGLGNTSKYTFSGGAVRILSTGSGYNEQPSLQFGRVDPEFVMGIAGYNNDWVTGSTNGDFFMRLDNNDKGYLFSTNYGNRQALVIEADGLVGINQPNASTTLDVNGTLRITNATGGNVLRVNTTTHQIRFGDSDANVTILINGTLNATGAITQNSGFDVAEMFSAQEPMGPGDLVIATGRNTVRKATKADADLVIGAVSTAPGFILANPELADPVLIGLAGRIPVKVTGTVQRGDFVTISDTPGVGMRANQAGFVIGRALEDAANGEVMIIIQPYYFNPSVTATGTIVGGSAQKTFFEDKSAAGQAALTGFASAAPQNGGTKVGQDVTVQLGGSEDVVVTLG